MEREQERESRSATRDLPCELLQQSVSRFESTEPLTAPVKSSPKKSAAHDQVTVTRSDEVFSGSVQSPTSGGGGPKGHRRAAFVLCERRSAPRHSCRSSLAFSGIPPQTYSSVKSLLVSEKLRYTASNNERRGGRSSTRARGSLESLRCAEQARSALSPLRRLRVLDSLASSGSCMLLCTPAFTQASRKSYFGAES